MILSAGIIDQDGVIYVARQYCEMTRSKVEALYAAFPRLITKGKQHTIIETNEVRYIYQSINQFYCVLITDKHSNILEDIRTLRLFVGAINEYAPIGKDEDSITQFRFDLLFAFDEIVALGVRQIDNLTQLRTIISMESEEEWAFVESLSRKEMEAKAKSAEKAKELDLRRKNEMLLQLKNNSGGPSIVGRGMGVGSSISSSSKPIEPIVESDPEPSKPMRTMSKGRAMKLRASSKK